MADDQALLLEEQIPALRRYAFALVRDHDAADDLVQDCLERALSRWYLRRPEGDLRAWLFTILRNLYINAYRARKRRGVGTAIGDTHPSVAPEQEAGLQARDVLAAIDQLPEEQKSLLLLIGVESVVRASGPGARHPGRHRHVQTIPSTATAANLHGRRVRSPPAEGEIDGSAEWSDRRGRSAGLHR